MADGGTIELNFRARLEQLERDMAGARSKVSRSADEMGDDANDRFGKKLSGLAGTVGKAAVLGIGAAAVGIGALLKSSVAAAEESRKVGAQTEAAIASTGGAAHVSAAQIGEYADKLAGLTGIDDEVIASGENILLTFTNVRNEVGKGNDIFNQGTKAALNMSVALGTDMKSASMLVGKALNDPIAGMTALTRSGIQFTAQQKEQVKAMVAAGDTLGAQKVILKELETQFGGSAEAAASPMARLKVIAGNLQEELGARLLPVVGQVAGFLADRLPAAIDRVGAVAGPVFREITGGFKAFIAAFKAGDGDVTSSGFPGAMERIANAARSVVDWVVANWPQIRTTVTEVLTTAQAVISGFVDVVMTIWDNFGSQIMAVAKAAWDFISRSIENAMNVIQGIIKVVTGIIHGDWGQVWEGIKQILSAAWDQIQNIVEVGMKLAREAISVGWELVKGVFTGAWDGIKGLVRAGVANVVDYFLGMAESVTHLAAKAFGWVPGVGDKLRDAEAAVKRFRDETNAALRGIDDKDIKVNTYYNNYHRDYYETIKGQDPYVGEMAAGGFVNHPTLSWVGEAGRELVLPLTDMDRTRELLGQAGLLGESSDLGDMGHWSGSDGGGGNVTVIVQGSVTTERELVDAVRRGIAGTSRYTGSPGF